MATLVCAGALPVFGQATIETLSQWNGIDNDPAFGEPSVATYGQTFVVPSGAGTLKSFAFLLDDGADPVNFQTFIMAWDGTKASGPILFQSGAMATTNNGGLNGFERFDVSFNGGLHLNPGSTYIAFFSASNLFDGTPDLSAVAYTPGAYAGGGIYTLNNGNNFSAVTTNPWDDTLAGLGFDLAFQLVFGPTESSSGGGGTSSSPQTLLLVDAAAIASALFSSAPTALAQRELALGASRTALHDFNGRLFRHRAGGGSAGTSDTTLHQGDDHVVTVGEGDGSEPGSGGKAPRTIGYRTGDSIEQRWRVFTSFDYGSLDIDADKTFLGLQSDAYAESAGVEYQVGKFILGGGLSFIQADTHDATDAEGVTFAGYVSYSSRGIYADLLYGITSLDHDIDRDTGLGTTAHAGPGSLTHTVNFNTGYNFHLGAWCTGPYAGLDYSHADIDGYTESGGGTAATKVSSQSVNSLISRVGWQVSRRMERTWGAITPQVRIGWERENLESNDPLTVGLITSPYYLVTGSFIRSTGARFEATLDGHGRGRDYFVFGGGVLIEIGAQLHLLLDYEGIIENGYAAHYAKLSLGYRF